MTFSAATLSGVVEPRAFRPQENFLANCQQRRLRKIDDVIDDPDRSSDENVYQFARSIADREGCALVVDLCAGSGRQFERFFASRSWETLQVDWIDRRQVSDTDESRPFLKVNLEIYDDLENLEAVLDSSRPTLFILSDVVGRLQDLRPLFRTLRRLLKRHPSNRLVATTPDRDQFDESEPGRLPENPGYVRLWTLNEFGLAVRSAGLNVQRIGWLTQDENDHRQGIVCCELSCTPEFYEDWLRNHNLPQMASDHLMLTTEHGDAERSGGIGAYVKSCDALDKSAQIVYVGFLGLPRDAWRSYCREKGWLHVFDLALVGEHSVDGIDPQDANISMYAILQVVFLCDQIRLIEYQDYEGIGYRVAQAKRAGLLPRSINVMAVAHGNHFYLDYASDSIDTRRRLTIDATERLSVELADVVVFPTQYIRRLYRDCAGYRVRSDRHLPLPATISLDGISNLERRQIETLVFFGKKTRQKGYDDFVDAVVALMTDSSSQAAKNVNRIVLLGVSEPDRRLLELPVQVEFSQRSHAEAKAMLSDFAADSLVVLPYRGDNHPLSFFEAVEADCQVLAYYAGGLPELVPTEVSEYALCNPDPNSLATGIERRFR